MKKNLILAACFCLLIGATSAMADVIDIFDGVTLYSTKGEFMDDVYTSDWEFTGTGAMTGGNKPSYTQWDFYMTNGTTNEQGVIYASDFKGNGGSGPMKAEVKPDGTLELKHNDANDLLLLFSFNDTVPPVNELDLIYIDSFYTGLDKWSSWSAGLKFEVTATYWLDGTLETVQGKTLDVNNQFFGIALDAGAYLVSVNFQQTGGTPNNGYLMDLGFGGKKCDPNDLTCGGLSECDDPYELGCPCNPGLGLDPAPGCESTVPEPGSILLLGTGIVGLGLVARRKLGKK